MKTHAVMLGFTFVAFVQTTFSATIFEDGGKGLEIFDEYDDSVPVVDARDKIDPLASQTSQFNAWLQGSPSRECPRGFSLIKHQCASCYKLITTRHSWEKAVDACQALHPDAHLVFINSEEEQQTVENWLRTQPVGLCSSQYEYHHLSFWLGGQRSNPADGRTPFYWKTARRVFHNMHYAKWSSGEPNNNDNKDVPESCIHMLQKFNYRWNDMSCWDLICAICEYDP